MIPNELIIIGGGASIKKGLSLGLHDTLRNRFTCGLNYGFNYFKDCTYHCFVDRDFYKKQKPNLSKLPLIIGKSGGYNPMNNTIDLPTATRYFRNLSGGVYNANLTGVFALSLGIYLMDAGNIFLLGYDFGGFHTSNIDDAPLTMKNKDILALDSHKRPCYSEDTEVFTNQGWKYFKDLKGDELILTRKYNGDTEWSKIIEKQIYRYRNKMYNINTKGIDIQVTPKHEFCLISSQWDNTPCKIKNSLKYLFADIDTIKQTKNIYNYYNIPKTFKWKGINQNYFILPSITYQKTKEKARPKSFNETKIKMKDWCYFLGLFLSEGHTTSNNYTIGIAQLADDKYIKNILKRISTKFSKGKDNISWRWTNKQLHNYLKQFGKSYQKFIPQNIKNLKTKYLKCLLETLVFGDGHTCPNGIIQYTTISKQLADDVQEIAYKCGYNAEIYYRKKRKSHVWKNKTFVPRHDQWTVQFNKSNKKGNRSLIYLRSLVRYNRISSKFYDGLVYDITVEKNHTLWVKRNNKCIWSSNCTHFYQDKLNHRGVGKTSYYNAKNRPRDNFMPFVKNKENKEKIKIYNVSPTSRIPGNLIEKISYEIFFEKMNELVHEPNGSHMEWRQLIRKKLNS